MEILINELSLTGQFCSIDNFINNGLTPFIAVISEIERSANLLYKKRNFWQSQVTVSNTIHDIFVGKISRERDEIRKSKSLLAALVGEPFWENSKKHNSTDNYEYNGNNVVDSSLAESCERDKVLISFIHSNYSSINLSVLKNGIAIDIDNLFDTGHYYSVAKSRGFIVVFSLKDITLFEKTTHIVQSKSVYKEISTDRYWYLDNFHTQHEEDKHYEVFNSNGEHLGEADLQGNIDVAKKVEGRTIEL